MHEPEEPLGAHERDDALLADVLSGEVQLGEEESAALSQRLGLGAGGIEELREITDAIERSGLETEASRHRDEALEESALDALRVAAESSRPSDGASSVASSSGFRPSSASGPSRLRLIAGVLALAAAILAVIVLNRTPDLARGGPTPGQVPMLGADGDETALLNRTTGVVDLRFGLRPSDRVSIRLQQRLEEEVWSTEFEWVRAAQITVTKELMERLLVPNTKLRLIGEVYRAGGSATSFERALEIR